MRVSSAISASMRSARAASSGSASGRAHLRGVRLPEPAALAQRVAEDALKLGRRRRQQPLGPGEALGIRERAHGRLHLLVREHARDPTRRSAA